MTVTSGSQVRTRDAAADRRRHRPGRRDHGAGLPSRPSPARTSSSRSPPSDPSTRRTTTRPGRLALPLGIAEVGIPGVRVRRRRPPTSPAPVSPTCCRSTASRSTSPSSDRPSTRSTTVRRSWSRAGPTPRGSRSAPARTWCRPPRGHNPPCASVPTTCTGWNIDQLVLDSAAGGGAGPAVFPTTAGTPSAGGDAAGPRPGRQRDLVAHRQPRRRRLGCGAALRARARPERQQGLARGGRTRPGCAGGLAPGGPRDRRSSSTASPTGGTSAPPTCAPSAAPGSPSS